MPPSFTRRLSGLVGALILGSVSAPAALAQDAPRDPATMVVLDSSGSMINNDAGGQTRIDAAKDAARTFIDDADTPLGLVTYGGNTGESDAEREAGCRDITLVTAPGDDTADDMLAHIDALEPRGFTPIGDSLTQAADALPSEGGTIVLVSDGIDTCAPPPVCEVAADLADRGVDIIINTVGFNVDAAAREELQCIADVAGGTYADASDAGSLAEELKKATTRTYRAYESDLEHIAGGTSDSEAADLPPGTDAFRTTLAAPPEGRAASSEAFFRTPVAEGERLVVSVQTFQEPQLGGIGRGDMVITPSLTGADGQDCRLDADLGAAASVSGVQTATVYSHVIGEDCDTDALTLELDRRGDWKAGEDLDVEVTVTRFGATDLTGTPEPAAELGDAPAIDSPAAEAEQVTPGVWFDDAAELIPGETVAAEIVPGETQFFRLPLEYGQQLGAVIEPVAESNDFADVRVGEQLAYTAYNEARAEVPLTRSNSFIGVQRPEATGYAAPVLFSNRYGGADGEGSPEATVEKLWLDGDQYFAVTFEKTFSQEEIDAQTQLPTLTYHLVADAVGDPVPGPSFAAVEAAAPTPASTGEEPEPSTDVEPETTAEESEESGGGAGVRLAVGAVVLVILGAAGFALSRRR